MWKQIFQALVVLSFASAAFAQEGGYGNTQNARVNYRPSQFSQYTMKGFSTGLEYSLMDADIQLKLKDSSGNSSAADGITQIRPEANLGGSFSNGIWGMIGGHLSYLTGGDINKSANQLGAGLQASVGFTPVRNLAMDIGYYYSVHKISSEATDELSKVGLSADTDESFVLFKQLRGRVSYAF